MDTNRPSSSSRAKTSLGKGLSYDLERQKYFGSVVSLYEEDVSFENMM